MKKNNLLFLNSLLKNRTNHREILIYRTKELKHQYRATLKLEKSHGMHFTLRTVQTSARPPTILLQNSKALPSQSKSNIPPDCFNNYFIQCC